ncbi:MAG: hypothetical protein JW857_01175 [Bacteroidales bacterium]|nr:hypothetical protein [Bacteroidales bacterium]
MMKTLKLNALFLFLLCTVFSLDVDAQFKVKKYKHAPDKTIVVLIGAANTSIDETQFPHLKFYYLPELRTGQAPDFITRLGTKNDLSNWETFMLFLVAKNGVVAYQNHYGKNMIEGYQRTSGSDLAWSILNKPLIVPDKKPLEDYLPTYFTKAKDAKADKKKLYTEGADPTFKDWKKGDIIGLELPDFEVNTAQGESVSIKSILNGNAGLIVFSGIKGNQDYSMGKAYPLPLLWHIEHVLYNYYPPRK